MTRFRFGARSVPGQHASAPGRAHGIFPSNSGIAPVAQSRIDAVAAAATRRAKEAISGIDSVRLYIFQPIKHGKACNCGTSPQDNVIIPLDDSNIVDIPEQADVSGDMKPRLKVRVHDVSAYDRHVATQPANEPDHNFGLTEADILGDGPTSSTTNTAAPYTGEMHGSGSLYLHSGEYDHEMPDQPEDTFGETELLADWEDRDGFNPDSILADSAYVLGNVLTTCPVCMGSGLLGGYNIFGATRIVLSSANATGGNNLGPEVLAKAPLPMFNLGPGETVEWSGLNFPNYYSMGWAIARNLRKRIGIAMEYTLNDGVLWKPIGNLEADNQINLAAMIIRVRNDSSEPIDFSHLEIVVFHNAVQGQVSNFSQSAGLADPIKGDALQITLPPEVGLVDRNALIAEAKYNLMWRVTTVTPIMTAKRQVINCEVSADLMQPTLVETTLYPAYSIEDPKTLTYGGIEPVLGMR